VWSSLKTGEEAETGSEGSRLHFGGGYTRVLSIINLILGAYLGGGRGRTFLLDAVLLGRRHMSARPFPTVISTVAINDNRLDNSGVNVEITRYLRTLIVVKET